MKRITVTNKGAYFNYHLMSFKALKVYQVRGTGRVFSFIVRLVLVLFLFLDFAAISRKRTRDEDEKEATALVEQSQLQRFAPHQLVQAVARSQWLVSGIPVGTSHGVPHLCRQ